MLKKEIAVVLFCALCMACLVDNKKAMQDYEQETKEAIAAELIEDWPNAEKHFSAALVIAEKIKWAQGTSMAKEKLGDVYAKTNRIAEAEKGYLEVKDACKSNLICPNLDALYDKIVLFYIYQARTPRKAEKIMDDMATMKLRLQRRDLQSRFLGYANDMRTAGFNEEANFLIKYITQMPNP